ncbi:MAG: hypothetical protein IJR00_09655 [Lachnospiraceae bacterium]|nr:hypothetical protein [Lachnospiraceae bacterium]
MDYAIAQIALERHAIFATLRHGSFTHEMQAFHALVPLRGTKDFHNQLPE